MVPLSRAMNKKRCPRCHVGGYGQGVAIGDGRPEFHCGLCGNRWTNGKNGGQYALAGEAGISRRQRRRTPTTGGESMSREDYDAEDWDDREALCPLCRETYPAHEFGQVDCAGPDGAFRGVFRAKGPTEGPTDAGSIGKIK